MDFTNEERASLSDEMFRAAKTNLDAARQAEQDGRTGDAATRRARADACLDTAATIRRKTRT